MDDVKTISLEPIPHRCGGCGSEVSVQVFGPNQYIERAMKLWLCSNNVQLKGTCERNGYLSIEAWNSQNETTVQEQTPVHMSDDILRSIALCDILKYQAFCKQKLKSLNLWDDQTESLHNVASEALENISRPQSLESVKLGNMEVEYDDSDDSVCVRHEDGRLIYVMPSGRVVVGNVTTENSNRPFVGYEFEELYNREFHFPEMIIAYVEGTESGEHVAVVKLDNDDGACIYSNSGMILSHRNTSLTLATTVDQLFTYKDELVSKKKERLVLTLQERKDKWMRSCFSDDITDSPEERNRRFIEEALELVQSLDMSRHEAHFMVDYVFDRDKGQPFQEVGGTILCLAALCNVHKIDMLEAGETELSRVWTKIETIRGKQKKKPNFSDDVNIISSRLTEDNKYFFFSNPALSVRTVSSSDFHTRYQTPISLLNLTNAVREIIAE